MKTLDEIYELIDELTEAAYSDGYLVNSGRSESWRDARDLRLVLTERLKLCAAEMYTTIQAFKEFDCDPRPPRPGEVVAIGEWEK